MKYYFAYDIADSKRRYRVTNLLKNYGLRVQYSFFECELRKEHAASLREQILEQMLLTEDSLLIYPICDNCLQKAEALGNITPFSHKSYQVI